MQKRMSKIDANKKMERKSWFIDNRIGSIKLIALDMHFYGA